jgi:hypothetical protein
VPWRIILAAEAAIRDAQQMKSDDALRTALADARVAAAVDACLDGYLKVNPTAATRFACTRAAIHWHAGREDAARTALADIPEAELNAEVARDFRVDLQAIKASIIPANPGF